MRPTRILLAACVVLGLLLRLAHLAAIANTAFPRVQLTISGADSAAHWEWSSQILAGDGWGRQTFHQFPPGMEKMAPLETWFRWWGSGKTFHREPVYVYFLALLRLGLSAFGARDSLVGVFGIQLLLGLFQPLVLFALGRRLLDERAGLLAALVGSLYGPFVFFEASLLRDWLPPILDPLLLLAILRARSTTRTRDWVLAGVLFGAVVLVRSSILLFLPLCLLWIVVERLAERRGEGLGERPGERPGERWSERWTSRLRPAILLLAGFVVGFAPLVVRNLVVGAPALSITNRAPEAIVESNAKDATPIGMSVPSSMPAILEEAQGSAFRVAMLTLQQYRGDWGAFLRKQRLKIWGAFDPGEHSDNLSYEYGRAISPALRYAPGFALVGLFGVAGLLAAIRRGGAHRLILFYVLSALGGQLVTVVVGRYRLGMVAVLIVSGAAYAFTCWDRLRSSRPREGLALLAIVPVLLGAHLAFQPAALRNPAQDTRQRELEYSVAVQIYVDDGRFDDALAEARRFGEHFASQPRFAAPIGFLEGYVRCAWGESLKKAGQTEAARAQAVAAKQAFEVPGQDPAAWFLLGKLFLELGGRDDAERFLSRTLAEDPSGPNAEEARRLLAITRRR